MRTWNLDPLVREGANPAGFFQRTSCAKFAFSEKVFVVELELQLTTDEHTLRLFIFMSIKQYKKDVTIKVCLYPIQFQALIVLITWTSSLHPSDDLHKGKSEDIKLFVEIVNYARW